MNWLNRLLGNRARTQPSVAPTTARCSLRPALELLEDRVQPSNTSVLGAEFHGNPAAGSTVWFHSSFHATGVGASPATIHVVNSSIDFAVKATKYHLNVPDANIVFSPTATKATTSFDVVANAWNTTVPSTFKGDVFLTGAAWAVPANLQGTIKHLKWKTDFQTDTAGIKLRWNWSAEAYRSFSSDPNALNVKPVDSRRISNYRNADPAGTPEAFKKYLVHGHGKGHVHCIGAHSGTKKVTPEVTVAAANVLSGRVQLDDNGVLLAFANVVVNLDFVNEAGASVRLSTTTGADGRYSFGSLGAGVYSISVVSPDGYMAEYSTAGSLGGDATTAQIDNIALNNGQAGLGYDFVQQAGVPNF